MSSPELVCKHQCHRKRNPAAYAGQRQLTCSTIPLVLVFQGFCNKVPQTEWLKQQNSIVSQFTVSQEQAPSKGPRETRIPGLSPGFSLFAGNVWCFLACRTSPPPPFTFTWWSPCVGSVSLYQPYWIKVHTNDLILIN